VILSVEHHHLHQDGEDAGALPEAVDPPAATGCPHPEAYRSSWEGDTCVRCRSKAIRLGRVVAPADPLEGGDESAFLAAMYAMPDEDHR
jgi:hypothetical protein